MVACEDCHLSIWLVLIYVMVVANTAPLPLSVARADKKRNAQRISACRQMEREQSHRNSVNDWPRPPFTR
jgi:hypothetical protein